MINNIQQIRRVIYFSVENRKPFLSVIYGVKDPSSCLPPSLVCIQHIQITIHQSLIYNYHNNYRNVIYILEGCDIYLNISSTSYFAKHCVENYNCS